MNPDGVQHVCVMGSPISHSLSPKLHGFWLRQYGIAGDYTAIEVTPERLPTALDDLVVRGFAGCNLTLPLKERALDLMDELDDSSHISGAVNTIVIQGGKKTGFNSDGFGFMESLRAQQPQWNDSHVVILGAGGAARGIAAALKNAGVENFSFINRTPEKAEKLAQELGLTKANTAATVPDDTTLLINCTSLGMTGQPPLQLDISGLPPVAVVCDIVYRPLLTPLLKEAQRRGHPVVEGLPMLLHQGRLGFKHWFGIDPAVNRALYEEIASCAK
jgi:shikimate dehydrogenase